MKKEIEKLQMELQSEYADDMDCAEAMAIRAEIKKLQEMENAPTEKGQVILNVMSFENFMLGKEIAELADIPATSVTGSITSLRKKGYVEADESTPKKYRRIK